MWVVDLGNIPTNKREEPVMTMEAGKLHWIAMAGVHGCIPKYLNCYETHDHAVEMLRQLHDLGPMQRMELKRFSFLLLNGNAYCSIDSCSCMTPELHSDTESNRELLFNSINGPRTKEGSL